MYVEAADAYGGPYATKWIIENPKGISNKRFNNKSKWLSYNLYFIHVFFMLAVLHRKNNKRLLCSLNIRNNFMLAVLKEIAKR